MIHKLIDIDHKLFLVINSIHSGFFDTLMYLFSTIYFWIPIYVFIVFIILKKNRNAAAWAILALIIAIAAADSISTQLFKDTFHRLRPCHNPAIEPFVHLVKGHCGGKYGFVSSHAANFFAFATFNTFYIKNKYLSITLFFIAILVAYSRIYLGVHYPADVTCGAILGFIIGFIVYKLLDYILSKKSVNLHE